MVFQFINTLVVVFVVCLLSVAPAFFQSGFLFISSIFFSLHELIAWIFCRFWRGWMKLDSNNLMLFNFFLRRAFKIGWLAPERSWSRRTFSLLFISFQQPSTPGFINLFLYPNVSSLLRRTVNITLFRLSFLFISVSCFDKIFVSLDLTMVINDFRPLKLDYWSSNWNWWSLCIDAVYLLPRCVRETCWY